MKQESASFRTYIDYSHHPGFEMDDDPKRNSDKIVIFNDPILREDNIFQYPKQDHDEGLFSIIIRKLRELVAN